MRATSEDHIRLLDSAPETLTGARPATTVGVSVRNSPDPLASPAVHPPEQPSRAAHGNASSNEPDEPVAAAHPPQEAVQAGPGQLGQLPSQGSAVGMSLAEAVQAAHEEGQEFGSSVARDAPALWLEAVLARRPRMPPDPEARLLQGSALPIDVLLHDEVRHALRRGFWDALERGRLRRR